MAKKYIAAGQDKDNVVSWSIGIDEDGDVRLKANGEDVLYIDNETGKLHLFEDEDLANLGLTLDDNGAIEVE